jgi:hypothetical protein
MLAINVAGEAGERNFRELEPDRGLAQAITRFEGRRPSVYRLGGQGEQRAGLRILISVLRLSSRQRSTIC